jgi:hypothetical protein
MALHLRQAPLRFPAPLDAVHRQSEGHSGGMASTSRAVGNAPPAYHLLGVVAMQPLADAVEKINTWGGSSMDQC